MAESALALRPLSELNPPDASVVHQWRHQELAGRLVEISDPEPAAALSFAFLLVREVQTLGQPAAWVSSMDDAFYPPDVQSNGIDLRSLPVLRMANEQDMHRAAETLLRSGAFQLVVLDLGRNCRVSPANQSRLNGLVRKYGACVLFLTEKPLTAPSIGPLISLRVRTTRTRVAAGAFSCQLDVIRDRRGWKWDWYESLSGVDGYF